MDRFVFFYLLTASWISSTCWKWLWNFLWSTLLRTCFLKNPSPAKTPSIKPWYSSWAAPGRWWESQRWWQRERTTEPWHSREESRGWDFGGTQQKRVAEVGNQHGILSWSFVISLHSFIFQINDISVPIVVSLTASYAFRSTFNTSAGSVGDFQYQS